MRGLRRTVAALLAMILMIAPGVAVAQNVDGPNFFTPAQVSGGVLGCDYASRSVANSVQPTQFYQMVVPGAYTATQTLTPTLSSTVSSWNWTSSVPLHMRMLGTITSNQGVDSPGTVNMGINYGGTNASLSLVNGHPISGSLIDAPFRLDVYLMPYASGTSGGGTSNMIGGVPRTGRLWAEFHYASVTRSQGATLGQPLGPIYFASFITTNFPISSNTQFNVEWRWASGAQTNSINRHSACWKLGE